MRQLILAWTIFALFVTPALAADRVLNVELNKLEANEGSCRAYLLLQNGAGADFQTLKLDIVMFDGDGVVSKRLAVEAAPLPSGKTSLKVFNIAGLPCTGISRVLLNAVLACADTNGTRSDCMDIVETAARGTVPLIK